MIAKWAQEVVERLDNLLNNNNNNNNKWLLYWNGDHQGEGNEADPTLPGRRGLEE